MSLVSQAEPPYIEKPGLAAAPIPAAATVGEGVIYLDRNTWTWLTSINGAAYTPLGGGGGAGTLDAAYQNGTAGSGNTILMTDAKGAVAFSSARTSGQIVSISAPGVTAAGAMQGLLIDLSGISGGLGNNIAAIDVTGPASTAAKSTTRASPNALFNLKNRASLISSFTTIVRNKSAVAGSIWMLGWDTTNFEGAVANSVLTGTTHCVTIDAQTNVTAGSQEVVGVRVLIPGGTSTTSCGVYVESSGIGYDFYGRSLTNTPRTWFPQFFVSRGDGTTTTISGTETARLGAFTYQIVTTGASLISSPVLVVDDRPTSASGTLGLSGNILDILHSPNPSGGGGVITDSRVGIGVTMTPVSSAAVGGMLISMGNNVSNIGFGLGTTWAGLAGTNGATVIHSISRNGTTTGAFTILRLDSSVATLTLGAALTGLNVDLSTNVTAGFQNVKGVQITMPATSDASGNSGAIWINSLSTGASLFWGSFRQTTGSIMRMAAGGATTTTGGLTGILCDLSTSVTPGAGLDVTGLRLAIPAADGVTSRGISVLSTQVAGQGIFVSVTPGSSAAPTGISVSMGNNMSATGAALSTSWTSLAGATNGTVRFSVSRAGGTTAPTTILKLDSLTSTLSLGAALTGLDIDLSTNVTPVAQNVNGVVVTIPNTTAGDTTGFAAIVVTNNSASYKSLDVRHSLRTGTTARMNHQVGASGQTGPLIGLRIDELNNFTAGSDYITPLQLDVGATTYADTVGRGAITIDSRATQQRTVDISVRNTNGTIFAAQWGANTNLAASMYGIVLDMTGLGGGAGTVTAGANLVTGILIGVPNSSNANSVGVNVTSIQTGGSGMTIGMTPGSSAAVSGIGITMGNNTSATGYAIRTSWTGLAGNTVGMLRVGYDRNGSTTGAATLARLESGVATLTLGAALFGMIIDLTTNVSPGSQQVQGLQVLVGASSSTTTAPISVSSTQSGSASSGVLIAMAPGSSAAVRGLTVDMGANANGGAIVITQSASSTGHQMVFSNVTDGTAFHIYGPVAGQLRIGAGQPTGTNAGREILLQASNASTTGAGGSIYLNEGAGAGGGARGSILVGTAAGMVLGFYGSLGATQQTPTGSRGGNAALASLLTALATIGLIVDGTSA